MRIGSFTWWFLIIFLILSGFACWWKRSFSNTEPLSSNTLMQATGSASISNIAAERAALEELSIIFVGDSMLDRNIRSFGEREGYENIIDPNLCAELKSADLVVANLEGPVTNNPSVSQGSEVGSPNNFRFTFSPESLQALKQCDISILNLGNNHSNDFGARGVASTREAVRQAGFLYFGDTGSETSDADAVLIWDDGERTLGFVNYNQFVSGSYERTLNRLSKIRQSVDFLVVVTHWGIEYQTTHNPTLQAQATSFAEAGADLIIGTHPHVIAPYEVIGTTPTYYSLGNFIFDQYFSEEVQQGLLVTATFDFSSGTISTEETRIRMRKPGITSLDALSGRAPTL